MKDTTSTTNFGIKFKCEATFIGRSQLSECNWSGRTEGWHIVDFKTTMILPCGEEIVMEEKEEWFCLPLSSFESKRGLLTQVRQMRRDEYLSPTKLRELIRQAVVRGKF